jgi:putative ABC transport system permease protein
MRVYKLIIKNSLRHRLRASLTVLGVALAILAFGIVRTLITAWYVQAENAPPDRLVTRNAVSLVFTLPLAYQEKIARVEGVKAVSIGNWFGGIYKDPKNFFAQFAVDMESHFKLYPEYIVDSAQFRDVLSERNAIVVGEKLAAKYGWKLGDAIRLTGTIYPGDWDFVVRAIYKGREPTTDVSTLLFHWKYLDEKVAQDMPGREGDVGWYVIQIDNPSQAAAMSERIDALFQNSTAETLTETEEAFQLGFVSMSGTIITGIRIVSVLIIGVVLLVLANTMAMAARERMREYAVLKTLGFAKGHLIGLIGGESLMISAIGTALGLLLLFPTINGLGKALGDFFPVIKLELMTVVWAIIISIGVGVFAALFPARRVLTVSIVNALRQVG